MFKKGKGTKVKNKKRRPHFFAVEGMGSRPLPPTLQDRQAPTCHIEGRKPKKEERVALAPPVSISRGLVVVLGLGPTIAKIMVYLIILFHGGGSVLRLHQEDYRVDPFVKFCQGCHLIMFFLVLPPLPHLQEVCIQIDHAEACCQDSGGRVHMPISIPYSSVFNGLHTNYTLCISYKIISHDIINADSEHLLLKPH